MEGVAVGVGEPGHGQAAEADRIGPWRCAPACTAAMRSPSTATSTSATAGRPRATPVRSDMPVTRQPFDECLLIGTEPRAVPGGGVLDHPLGLRRGRDRHRRRWVAEPVLEQRLRPRRDAELGQRRQIGGARRPTDQPAGGERSHQDHAEPELLGEREDAPLDLALVRVVRNLDGADPPGAHHRLQLVEGIGPPVRRSDDVDDALVTPSLELLQATAPRDEVVDLEDLDAPAEVARARRRSVARPRRRRASTPSLRRSRRCAERRAVAPRMRSACPYIGDESTKLAPWSRAASVTCWRRASTVARRTSATCPCRRPGHRGGRGGGAPRTPQRSGTEPAPPATPGAMPLASVADLREHYRPPGSNPIKKVIHHLDVHCADFIAKSPFFVLSTADADGVLRRVAEGWPARVRAGPRRAPPGVGRPVGQQPPRLVPEPRDQRSRRAAVPHPRSRRDAARNGSAELVTDPRPGRRVAVDGKPARVTVVVTVAEAYVHCAKALRRAELWSTDHWLATPRNCRRRRAWSGTTSASTSTSRRRGGPGTGPAGDVCGGPGGDRR